LTKRVELILNQLYEQYRLQYGTLTTGASICEDVDANSSIRGASSASNIEETEENYSDFVKS
jgi:hypothetical protein